METLSSNQVVTWIKSFIEDETIVRFFQGIVCFTYRCRQFWSNRTIKDRTEFLIAAEIEIL